MDMRFHCTSILDHVNMHTIVNIVQFSCLINLFVFVCVCVYVFVFL